MIQLIVMTEEPSMEECLNIILKKIIPEDWFLTVIPHEGKQDLEKSIPRKLKAFKSNVSINYKFVIVRDQDSGDCKKIKRKIEELCDIPSIEKPLIRIACRELESWFLGDLQAVEKGLGLPNISQLQTRSKYRKPDELGNPSEELKKLNKNYYSKILGAKKISPYLNLESNKSTSFNYFIEGVRRLS